jgi:hypothetical protein
MKYKFDSYLKTLRETPLDEHTEHTGRASLQSLLKAFAANGTAIQHEPQRQGGSAPDFKITRDDAMLGYVEVKAVGADLNKVLKSDQIKRYKELSGNLIVTDYLAFIWIEGDCIHRATLLTPHELESGAFRLGEKAAEDVSRLLQGFFSTLGKTGGEENHTLLTAELATHSHGITDLGHTHTLNFEPGNNFGSGSFPQGTQISADSTTTNSNTTGITVNNAGSGNPHNTTPPAMVMNWIIKT